MYGGYLQFTAGEQIPADPATWTTEENKAFERALVDVPEEAPDRWWQIAAQIPGKAPEDIHLHYLLLLHDINLIDSGSVDLPQYESEDGDLSPQTVAVADLPVKEGRRKGVPWSEDEHRYFVCAWTFGQLIRITNRLLDIFVDRNLILKNKYIQEVFGRTGEIWKGRLEEYFEMVGEDENANTSGEPCAEILSKAECEEGEQEKEYS